MPQASEELRALFDNTAEKALAHLRSRGYKLTTSFNWQLPSKFFHRSQIDMLAIQFMHAEYDYGYLRFGELDPTERIVETY